MFKKVRKVRMTRWSNLTLSEKILKVVMKLVKWVLIAAVAVVVIGGVAAVVSGVVVGLAIMNAVGEGFMEASRARRPGEYYVRFW